MAQRHLLKCHGKLPPGDEIYRDPVAGISVLKSMAVMPNFTVKTCVYLLKCFRSQDTLL